MNPCRCYGKGIAKIAKTDEPINGQDKRCFVHFSLDGSGLFCYVLGVIALGQVGTTLHG